jgi:uncharacterized protein
VPVVVSDTSPIRALAHLALLDVLRQLFGEVIVPPAVVEELERPRSQATPVILSHLGFISCRTPGNLARVADFMQTLDPGESEALALAEELQADLILMDERLARRRAAALGLPTLGALGVLLRAKQERIIPAIAPLIDRLRAELRFFMTDDLRADLLRRAGE